MSIIKSKIRRAVPPTAAARTRFVRRLTGRGSAPHRQHRRGQTTWRVVQSAKILSPLLKSRRTLTNSTRYNYLLETPLTRTKQTMEDDSTRYKTRGFLEAKKAQISSKSRIMAAAVAVFANRQRMTASSAALPAPAGL